MAGTCNASVLTKEQLLEEVAGPTYKRYKVSPRHKAHTQTLIGWACRNLPNSKAFPAGHCIDIGFPGKKCNLIKMIYLKVNELFKQGFYFCIKTISAVVFLS